MELTEHDIKCVVFEIFSAGFLDGYNHDVDIRTSFERFYQSLVQKEKEYEENSNY